jgi:hypothetical protein
MFTDLDLSGIKTNIPTTTELWLVLEQIEQRNFTQIDSSAFAEMTTFTIELNNKEQYEITEFFEQITSVQHLSPS